MKNFKINLENQFEIEYNEKVLNNGKDFNSFIAYVPLKENFKNIYESDLIKNQFKKEFLQAPKIKNYRLYKQQFLTEEEEKNIIVEANSKITIIENKDEIVIPSVVINRENEENKIIPLVVLNTEGEIKLMDLYRDFCLLSDIENETYYLNDITSINIYNVLFQIEKKFQIFKQNIKEPKIVASAITIILNESNLDNLIKIEILNSLLNKNQNELISIYKITFEDWSLAKDIFNKEIFELINGLKEFTDLNSNDIVSNNNQVNIDTSECSTRKIITEIIEASDINGWKYSFFSEIEFLNFVNVLTQYFKCEEYKLPEEIIKLRKSTKTRVSKYLRDIHRELGQHSLTKDEDFFRIIKTLNHFKDLNKNEIYTSLTK